MRFALAAVGIAAVTNRVGAEVDPKLGGKGKIDYSKQQSTQVLHHHEGDASPWWQRAWAAGSQLMKRTPQPQDGQDAPIAPGTGAATEEQCSGVQVVTSTITPVTTATITTTKEATATEYVYPSQGTTTDADDEKTVIVTPSDYGVDLAPVTTTVTRYPSDHSWDHPWTAGSWNSEWEGNTATYTVTISEIEMPVTSTIYPGAESSRTAGMSAGPDQDTTELSPAGPQVVTKTVTVSNVEIPWTTTKYTSQELVTSTFTSTADGSNGGVIQTTTITEGDAPQTTVATQSSEPAESMDGPSYVYTTVTYTTRLSPTFQNPNDTSAITSTASTRFPATNDTQPPNGSLTTVTSTYQVPASTAIETQYTTTLVSGNTTQTVVLGNLIYLIIGARASYSIGVFNKRKCSHLGAWIDIIYALRRTANNTVGLSIQWHIVCVFKHTAEFHEQRSAHGIFCDAVNGIKCHFCHGFEWTKYYVVEFFGRAVVSHAVFNKSDFIRSAAADDFDCVHDLKRLLRPSAYEVIELILSYKPAFYIYVKCFSISGVLYIAVSVIERFGIAVFPQLFGPFSDTIFDLAVLSKLDLGLPTAFELTKYLNYPGFDFKKPSAFWSSELDYCGAPAFIWLGIFRGDLFELSELLGPPTYQIG
ncbi:hypothetical protein KC332_g7764 [Hortaea werneckii]|nr:hypothetical protein KC358_g7488 [Hortaea werneckii]KAI6934803.1 hypothetical protein KC341_g7372 [Hortaea werneckii]KAI6969255.1 hypothetical protein KC321_g7992 [Hortaea werneckii]KAI7034640.1 hypothetical protein KC366_g8323 [Hortaea werneckii]KAI7035368.1 hypothetical protein KC362_g7798 [Hortaea werneckii]